MSDVKVIYAAIRALGIADEEDRRDLYERVTGKRRLREMTPSEKQAVVTELRRLGFRAPAQQTRLEGPWAKKLQALWISAWQLGLVRNRTDAALIAFVRRQTGIDHPRWLRDAAEAAKAVEALKSWMAREGGVCWSVPQSPAWKNDPLGQVVAAQWARIPAEIRATMGGFDLFVKGIVCPTGGHLPITGLDGLRRADWIAVCNALGVILRGDAPAARGKTAVRK